MWHTRQVNAYLNTNYKVEEIAEWDPLLFSILSAVMQGMNPPPKNEEGDPPVAPTG